MNVQMNSLTEFVVIQHSLPDGIHRLMHLSGLFPYCAAFPQYSTIVNHAVQEHYLVPSEFPLAVVSSHGDVNLKKYENMVKSTM